MDSRIRIVVSECTDPFMNLALENRLFTSLGEKERVLLFYRNAPCVVIGRFQNPFMECSLDTMERQGIPLVRRQSGGGAVYHDPGNLNFSFLCPREWYSKEENFRIVTQGINRTFGLATCAAGRNDITLEGRKISGSAFRQTSSRALHHGTLLLDADLHRLEEYLSPGKLSIDSAGIRSVPSEVVNLKRFYPEITWEMAARAVAEEFLQYRGAPGKAESITARLTDRDITEDREIVRVAEQYRSWEWLYGRCPKFTISIGAPQAGPETAVICTVEHGIITGVGFSGNVANREKCAGLSSLLAEQRFSTTLVTRALEEL